MHTQLFSPILSDAGGVLLHFKFFKRNQLKTDITLEGLNISHYAQKAGTERESLTCLYTNNNIEIHRVIPHRLLS